MYMNILEYLENLANDNDSIRLTVKQMSTMLTSCVSYNDNSYICGNASGNIFVNDIYSYETNKKIKIPKEILEKMLRSFWMAK